MLLVSLFYSYFVVSALRETTFPFTRLAPEIRNMIYRYVLPLSKPCYLDDLVFKIERKRKDIAILLVNREIHNEASSILYANTPGLISVGFSPNPTLSKTIFRIQRSSGGIRTLRSGHFVDTATFSGMMYPHILARLVRIELRIQWFRAWDPDWQCWESNSDPMPQLALLLLDLLGALGTNTDLGKHLLLFVVAPYWYVSATCE